jgi:hypothetical protein
MIAGSWSAISCGEKSTQAMMTLALQQKKLKLKQTVVLPSVLKLNLTEALKDLQPL